jgi:hypothetical protein
MFNSLEELQSYILENEVKRFDTNNQIIKLRDKFSEQDSILEKVLVARDLLHLSLLRGKFERKVESAKGIITRYSTFSDDLLLPFLADYISEKENKKHVILQRRDKNLCTATKTYPLNLYGEMYYNIIIEEDNKEKFACTKRPGVLSGTIKEHLEACSSSKHICLLSLNSYSLMKGNFFCTEYADFPYLRDVALQLVDMKLSNPFISDKERLNLVLNKEKDQVKQKVMQ